MASVVAMPAQTVFDEPNHEVLKEP